MKNIKNKNRGFSYIELLVAVAITAVVAVVAGQFQANVLNYNRMFSQFLKAADELRGIMRPIAGEVRAARTSENCAYAIETAGDNEFTFYTDYDADGQTERMRYFLDGTDFKRGIIEPSGVPAVYDSGAESITTIASGIDTSVGYIFQYYDENYDGSTDPLTQPVSVEDVRLVEIEVTIDTDPLKLPEPITISTQVSIRNLKTNL